MQLSEAGEARVRGYLFMLESSLRTFLRRETAADAVREVESHIRERVRDTSAVPNERDALNRLLEAMAPPHRLARAYSAELAVDEAVASGHALATVKAVLALAFHTTEGFIAGFLILMGYLVGAVSLLVLALKPLFPNNVGIFTVDGRFHGAGAQFPLPVGAVVSHGWEVALACSALGIVLLLTTHVAARSYLRRVRRRRELRREALA
jgi:uncharacterized membrane protein